MDLFSNKGRVLNINSVVTTITGGSSIWGEEPDGVRDGSNKIFTTANNFIATTTRVYFNGLRRAIGATKDYTETGVNEITFNYNIPAIGNLLIDYDPEA